MIIKMEIDNLIVTFPINCNEGKKTTKVYIEPINDATNNLILLVLVLVILLVAYNIMQFIIIFSINRYSAYTYNPIPPLKNIYTKNIFKTKIFMSIIYYL